MGLSSDGVRDVLRLCESTSLVPTWSAAAGPGPLDSAVVDTAELRFSLSKDGSGADVVSVTEVPTERRHTEALAKHVSKLGDLTRALDGARPLLAPIVPLQPGA